MLEGETDAYVTERKGSSNPVSPSVVVWLQRMPAAAAAFGVTAAIPIPAFKSWATRRCIAVCSACAPDAPERHVRLERRQGTVGFVRRLVQVDYLVDAGLRRHKNDAAAVNKFMSSAWHSAAPRRARAAVQRPIVMQLWPCWMLDGR